MASIPITVSNQKAFLWNIQDIQTLRVQHHICGILTGTLPQVGQQNVFLGLPLMLLPEEVVLLVKNKLAHIVDDQRAHVEPTVSQVGEYHTGRKMAIQAQQAALDKFEDDKREKMLELHKDKIEARRIQKERAKVVASASLLEKGGEDKTTTETGEASSKLDSFEIMISDEPSAQNLFPSSTPVSTPLASSSTAPSQELRPPPTSTRAYTILVQPTSLNLPWYDPTSTSFSTLASAREAGVWNYPSTDLQTTRCRVFEDLWSKGHFMGGGLRFGGDFLIYPGDPLRFHSHFTLTVLTSPDSSIMPLDLVAYGRLATGVKKAHLLASWNEKEGKADYLSLEWAAFG